MAGLLDLLTGQGGAQGGLLDFLRANALNQNMPAGLPSDTADYSRPAPMSFAPAQQPAPQIASANQPSPLDAAPWPSGPVGAPSAARAEMPAPIVRANQPSPLDNAQWPAGPVGAPSNANAAMPKTAPMSFAPPPQAASADPAAPAVSAAAPASPGVGDRLALGAKGFFGNMAAGPVGALIGGIGAAVSGQPTDAATIQAHGLTATARALLAKGADISEVQAAMQPGNTEVLKTLVGKYLGSHPAENLGSGYIRDPLSGKITRAYEPDDKTPQSVLEYKYYVDNLPKGQQPMDYATFSTAKARAGATNINNNVDMNSGVTYDKQLSEGLGKAHTSLATGVEDAQTRARDIAAMQGAIDAIQKNGGTTGGLGQQQILDLKKTVNAGASALGIDQPFSEADLADKEFLTKFNRSMAGAQAKNAVGSRVTNFEMSNYLKANPGLDMSLTGNQRLLGIQAQIEQRNIAVGNAIRDATAQAISQGQKINPVTVQKIITAYDDEHHIKDPVTGQDLTQSYALPEFQNTPTNASMAGAHGENLKAMEKTIGGTTYVQRNGQWYPKQ
jgi:hypothetical protein